jgi:phage head maturation protease
MTVSTAEDLRVAADLRRRAADAARHERGDIAYKQYRSAAQGVGMSRPDVRTPTQLRAKLESRNGRDMIHTSGYFTKYSRAYPMWDAFGEYSERVMPGSGAKSLARGPDVAWLVNHKGVTMARTRNNTLELSERADGGWHDAWLNPERDDVQRIRSAIDDGLVDEMSYAFMIPDGGGWWSDDFDEFQIREYDIDRGDVSAVNYGANPYTNIAARAAEVLADLEHLPAGAQREAMARLDRRLETVTRERVQIAEGIEEVTLEAIADAEIVDETGDDDEAPETATEERSTPVTPQGRSIAYIEAWQEHEVIS